MNTHSQHACTHTWVYTTHTLGEDQQILPLSKKEDIKGATGSPNVTHCPLKPELVSVANKVVFKETQISKEPLYAHFCCVSQHWKKKGRRDNSIPVQFSLIRKLK